MKPLRKRIKRKRKKIPNHQEVQILRRVSAQEAQVDILFGSGIMEIDCLISFLLTLCANTLKKVKQKDVNKRNLVIQTMRVRKEFYEQEKELEMSKARKYAHKLSAFGLNMPNQTSTVDLDDTPSIEDENIEDSPFKAPRDENLISKRINRSSTVTRSTVSRSLESQIDNILILPASINTTTDEGTQTENLFLEEVRESAMPQISTRKKPTKKRF